MNLDNTTTDVDKDAAEDKRAWLESLGYRTAHLSSSDIDELVELVERKQPALDWRLKL